MKNKKRSALASRDARGQAEAAIVLMSIIPALAVFFMGMMSLPGKTFPPAAQIGVMIFTTLLAFGGYQIIRKYPENILKLREYIGEVAKGTLPEEVTLLDTQSSDDLKFIEDQFNAILEKMRQRIADAEERLRVEQALRKTVEQQQQGLLEAERQRTMIQSLGSACHHLAQPATVLSMHLQLLRDDAATDEARERICQSLEAFDEIRDILERLRQVSEYKTIPDLSGGPGEDDQILAI